MKKAYREVIHLPWDQTWKRCCGDLVSMRLFVNTRQKIAFDFNHVRNFLKITLK